METYLWIKMCGDIKGAFNMCGREITKRITIVGAITNLLTV